MKFILILAAGTALGYAHTWVAVKMLFRPRRAYHLGRWRLPLTPGLFVKRRTAFARAMGSMAQERFANLDDIVNLFYRAQDQGTVAKFVESMGPIFKIAWVMYAKRSTRESFRADCEKLISGLRKDNLVAGVIADKIGVMSVEEVEMLVMEVAHRELRAIVWVGAAMGMLIAALQRLWP
jgi:uncharacterized membrane protein YheB (UPF0754 family)